MLGCRSHTDPNLPFTLHTFPVKPIEGKVEINASIAPLIELGMGFDPELTGRENTNLKGTLLGCTNREMSRKMDQIVAFSALNEFIDAPLRTYSSGMVDRLGFAIANDVDPYILIVDEILGGGDAGFKAKCAKRIEGFRKKGLYGKHKNIKTIAEIAPLI